MGLDLSSFLWPDIEQGRQPRFAPVPNPELAPAFVIHNRTELVTGLRAALNSTANDGEVLAPGGTASGIVFPGTATCYASLPNNPALQITGPLTLVWVGVVNSFASYNFLAATAASNGATNNPFELRLNTSGQPELIRANATAYTAYPASQAVPLNTPIVMVVTHSGDIGAGGSGCSVTVNGTPLAIGYVSPGGSGPATASSAPTYLGTRGDFYTYGNHSTALLAGFSRVFSADEIAKVTENPWRLLAPPVSIWIGGAPAVTSASIVAAESPDTVSVSTTVTTGAIISATDAADTALAIAATLTTAQLSATESTDAASIAASVGAVANASISTTESSDTAYATATAWTTAQVLATESTDTAVATAATLATAQIASVESGDTANIQASAGSITYSSIAATESTDTALSTANVWMTAQVASVDSADTAALSSSVTTGATIAATEAGDSASVLAVSTTARLVATDSADTATVIAVAGSTTYASIAAVDGADACAISSIVTTGAIIAGTDGADSAIIAAKAWMTAQVAAIENADVAAIATAVTTAATIAGIESSDVSALVGASGWRPLVRGGVTANRIEKSSTSNRVTAGIVANRAAGPVTGVLQ